MRLNRIKEMSHAAYFEFKQDSKLRATGIAVIGDPWELIKRFHQYFSVTIGKNYVNVERISKLEARVMRTYSDIEVIKAQL